MTEHEVIPQNVDRLIDASYHNVKRILEDDPYMGEESLYDCYLKSTYNPQIEVLCSLLRKENVFISGPAGSGKSSIIQPFRAMIEAEYPNIYIESVAPTGVAAENIGGSTIHKFAALWLDNPAYASISHMANVDVLIVDEVSMVPVWMLEELDKRMQKAKRSKRPFGGVQVILLGDFMQLPPVPDRSKSHDENQFCFYSKSWRRAKIKPHYMDRVYRAKDFELKKILDEICEGQLSAESVRKLEDRVDPQYQDDSVKVPEKDGKKFIRMFTVNKDIDTYNQSQLDDIEADEYVFKHRVSRFQDCNISDKQWNKIVKNNSTELRIKRMCVVSLTKNFYIGPKDFIPNGSIGTVMDIDDSDPDNPSVLLRMNDGRFINVVNTVTEIDNIRRKGQSAIEVKGMAGEIRGLPLRLGYAITVHKSQGKTYDGVVVDLSRLFTPGLGYVAISRIRSIDDLIISKMDISQIASVGEDSKDITKAVKDAAMDNRKKTEEEQFEHYEILEDKALRDSIWITDEVMKQAEKILDDLIVELHGKGYTLRYKITKKMPSQVIDESSD